jgi:hypothetical protein
MPKRRVHGFIISLDGYGAGPDRGRDKPLGAGGEALHEWFLPTRMSGKDGTTGVDDEFAARGFDSIGAWIISDLDRASTRVIPGLVLGTRLSPCSGIC